MLFALLWMWVEAMLSREGREHPVIIIHLSFSSLFLTIIFTCMIKNREDKKLCLHWQEPITELEKNSITMIAVLLSCEISSRFRESCVCL